MLESFFMSNIERRAERPTPQELYTPAMDLAVRIAKFTAAEQNSDYVKLEHLVTGLANSQGDAQKLLIDLAGFAKTDKPTIAQFDDKSAASIPFSPEVTAVIASSIDEAEKFNY